MSRSVRLGCSRAVAIFCAALFLVAPASDAVLAANGSVTYAYDALGRITAAFYDTGACIVYSYDAVGNRLSETILVLAPTGAGVWDCSTWDSGKWGT